MSEVIPGFWTLITRVNPEEREYDEAIGRFITVFAEAESSLLYVAVHYTAIKPFIVGLAALAPLRVDSGITVIKRVIEARRLRSKLARELLHALEQFAVINKARNDLLHFGIGSNQVITNEHAMYHKRLVRRRPFSMKIVRQLLADTEDISMYFTVHFAIKPDKVTRLFRKVHPLGELQTWRYKYLEPKSRRPQPRVKFPRRGGPPNASHS